MKIGIWVKDKLVYEEEIINGQEKSDLLNSIEVMQSDDGKRWREVSLPKTL